MDVASPADKECLICFAPVTSTDLLYNLNICKCKTEKMHYTCWLVAYKDKDKCDLCQENITRYKSPNTVATLFKIQTWTESYYKLLINPFHIYIKNLEGQTYTIAVNGKTTVEQLKILIYAKCYIPADAQRLIYAGKQLENEYTLEHYNVQPKDTLHLVLRMTGD